MLALFISISYSYRKWAKECWVCISYETLVSEEQGKYYPSVHSVQVSHESGWLKRGSQAPSLSSNFRICFNNLMYPKSLISSHFWEFMSKGKNIWTCCSWRNHGNICMNIDLAHFPIRIWLSYYTPVTADMLITFFTYGDKIQRLIYTRHVINFRNGVLALNSMALWSLVLKEKNKNSITLN